MDNLYHDGRLDKHGHEEPPGFRFCPIHHIEDDCYEQALQRSWDRLKERHSYCRRDDCVVDENYKMILHGSTGVSATTYFFWRDKRYL